MNQRPHRAPMRHITPYPLRVQKSPCELSIEKSTELQSQEIFPKPFTNHRAVRHRTWPQSRTPVLGVVANKVPRYPPYQPLSKFRYYGIRHPAINQSVRVANTPPFFEQPEPMTTLCTNSSSDGLRNVIDIHLSSFRIRTFYHYPCFEFSTRVPD